MFEAKAPGVIVETTMFSGASSGASRSDESAPLSMPHRIGIMHVDRQAIDPAIQQRLDQKERRFGAWIRKRRGPGLEAQEKRGNDDYRKNDNHPRAGQGGS
jgi:hypothetical protein